MNIKNNTGPKTDPWGIPLVTSSQDHSSPFMMTLCFLPSRKAFIHARHFPVTPFPSSFASKRLFGTVSKAF